MKKRFAIVLIFCLLLPLLGCTNSNDGVLFYYPRKEIVYGQEDGVIASESRDVSGHEDEIAYLLILYLEGPHNQELKSPFPAGTMLEGVDIQEDHLSIILSREFDTLQGMNHTIACSCIAYTCFANTEYASVSIRSSTHDTGMTVTRDNIVLSDAGPTNPK